MTTPADGVDDADDWWPNLLRRRRFHPVAPGQWRFLRLLLRLPCDPRQTPTAVATRTIRLWRTREDSCVGRRPRNPFCCFAGCWHRRCCCSALDSGTADENLRPLPSRYFRMRLMVLLPLLLRLLMLLLSVEVGCCCWSTSWRTVSTLSPRKVII